MRVVTSVIRWFHRIQRDRRGAVAIEFAFLFPIAAAFTFGLIEFSLILFDYHRLSEATRRGVRVAIIQAPVADLSGLSGSTNSVFTCTGTGTDTTTYTVSCSGTSESSDAVAIFQTIMTDMQGIKPDLVGTNITISYRDTCITGCPGSPNPGLITPMITVQITGYTYTYFIMAQVESLLKVSGASGDVLGGSTFMTFPNFTSSRVGPTLDAS